MFPRGDVTSTTSGVGTHPVLLREVHQPRPSQARHLQRRRQGGAGSRRGGSGRPLRHPSSGKDDETSIEAGARIDPRAQGAHHRDRPHRHRGNDATCRRHRDAHHGTVRITFRPVASPWDQATDGESSRGRRLRRQVSQLRSTWTLRSRLLGLSRPRRLLFSRLCRTRSPC